MVQFIKTLPYELHPHAINSFEYLARVALQTINPQSTADAPLAIHADIVFHSPLRRVSDTLARHQKNTCRDYLREIPFDLKQLCTKKEWETNGSVIVRKRFKEAFIKDSLPITRRMVFAQIRAMLKECARILSPSRTAVLSHSFRIKLIEAYIKTQGTIVEHPDRIHAYLLDTETTYPFGGGFMASNRELQYALDNTPA